MRWCGRGARLTVGLCNLAEPLVYVCDAYTGPGGEPAAIDLSAPVSPSCPPSWGRELPYWPTYSGLLPHQRRYYLQWLAGGRQVPPSELGYVFLYFYNLERRALLDAQDVRDVYWEVRRLRKVLAGSPLGESGSWEGYSSSFLWMLLLRFPGDLDAATVKDAMRANTRWSEDNLAAALISLGARGARLTASTAYVLAPFLPATQQSVVSRRVPEQFEELFKTRFREAFPEGLDVQVSARKRTFLYKPASSVLPPCEASFQDPIGAPSRYKRVSDIWNACVQDLKKLGTTTYKGATAGTVEHWNALPEELRAGQDHPLTDAVCDLVTAHTNDAGRTFVPAGTLARSLRVNDGVRLTVGESRRVAETLEHVGYLVEPDPRLSGRALRANEEVTLFLKVSTEPVDAARYTAAAAMLQFGFLVANADGKADERELTLITHHLEAAFELHENEARRLEAARAVLTRCGPDRPLLRKIAKGLGKLQRQAVGRLLLAIVAADGVITEEEQKALRSACAMLDVDLGELRATMPPPADTPVTVVPAGAAAPGEPIPPPPGQTLVLNRDAIANILRETQDVAKIIAEAMAVGDDQDEGGGPSGSEVLIPPPESAPLAVPLVTALETVPGAAVTPDASSGPPARYRALYVALVAREGWPLKEADALARAHSLMLAGAVDALNEWAAEALGGQIFYEDGDRLVIERALLPQS